ncbi:hypothetical protein Sru01_21380 [Sphaerisporangium rufum]|uniref:Uncharacterized protein n=1 Tax=Sphaerisporangium rufum TaxID=1381558 RepID=A0A919UXM2_9ACTN|nr:hypothetical protein Sru01_21380 [Sphaerisporangium rufum]
MPARIWSGAAAATPGRRARRAAAGSGQHPDEPGPRGDAMKRYEKPKVKKVDTGAVLRSNS